MKNFIPVFLFLLALPAFSMTNYKIDPSHSEVGFKVKHLVVSTVPGKFKEFEGNFKFDEKTGKVEDVQFKIKAASIDTNEPKRDEHLRSKDFFEVDKYPTIEFKSTKVETSGKKPTRVHGDLTMHGVTKNVALKLKYNGTIKDPWGNQKLGFEANTKLNREDFNLKWNKALETGGVVVGKEVEIIILGEATAEAEKAK
ncbi:MAG: YceI family protein [Bdellovibrionales bacterium]